MLIRGRFRAFARTREVQFGGLQHGISRTARNRLDFVLAANRLYGARIRGARAPASLKPLAAAFSGALGGVHPGRARPGLIEASGDFIIGWSDKACIRGARAPASLKRRLYVRTRPSVEGHPGRARPGLIEATRTKRTVCPPRTRIRGARAPASLKRVDVLPAVSGCIGHPGRARPGLIEARRDNWPVMQSSKHPGRARPGLIEARRFSNLRKYQGLASGARAPRPH